jgi:hypothetical protein
MTVRGELRAAWPPARRWRGRLQEVPELGGKGVLQAPLRRRRRILSERLNPCKAWRDAAKAQADLAELKAAQARGSLLDAEAVEREWSDVLGTVRAGMLAVPSRAGAIDVEVRAVMLSI